MEIIREGITKSVTFECERCHAAYVAEPSEYNEFDFGDSIVRGCSCPICNWANVIIASKNEEEYEKALEEYEDKYAQVVKTIEHDKHSRHGGKR